MDDKELPVDYFAPIVTISERPPPKIRKIKIKIEPNEEGEMSGEIVRPKRRGRPRKEAEPAAAVAKKKKKKSKKGRSGEESDDDDDDWSSSRRRRKKKGERASIAAPDEVEVKAEPVDPGPPPEDGIKEEIKEEPSDELCVEVPIPEELKHVSTARQEDKKFKCPLCTKDLNDTSSSTVYTQKELKQHYKQSHPGKRLRQSRFSNEVHPCDVCGKEFRSASAVKDHIETHNNYYYCDVCNASQKKILEHIVHLRVHSGSFRCLMCDFSTPDINAITDHVNNHEDSFNRFFPDVEVEMKIGDDALRCFESDAEASSAKKSSSEDDEYTPPGHRRRKPSMRRRRRTSGKAVEKVKRQEHKVWTCKRCLEEFESRRHLTDHTKTYHAKDEEGESATFKYDEAQDIYVCSTCSAEYHTKDEVLEHVAKVHEEFYTCEVCEHTAKKAYNFAVHVKTHNPEEIYSCPLCSYSTPRRTCLRTHIDRMHYHKFYYTCATCGKGFNDSAIFKEHNNEHLGLKPFVCVVCNKTFVYSRYMLIHQTRYHTVHIEGTLHKTQCSICLKVFSKVPTLLKHITTKHSMSSTTPEKRHLCDMCGKGFGTSDKLKIHYRIHTGDKPFACRYCSKRFTKRDYLVMHERVHTGEKPYICKFCGKCFNQAASLRIHVRGHTGERPYVCEFCNVGYISRGSLNIHMKICKALY